MSTAPITSDDEFRLAGRSLLVEDVTHQLRELILTHKLHAGERLLQVDLAARLGVSRTPLREAIRLLERDGLVRISNGNRTVEVVRFNRTELRQLYELREVIDGLAARLLARTGLTPTTNELITHHLHRLEETVFPLQPEDFFISHLAFHTAIAEHCGNPWVRAQIPLVRMTAASLRDEFPRLIREGPKTTIRDAKTRAQQSINQHRAILDAIRSGNETQAETAARHHIACTLDTIIPQLPPDEEPVNR